MATTSHESDSGRVKMTARGMRSILPPAGLGHRTALGLSAS